ncbi:MAG: hypothetical protein MJK10_13590 [Pseudomonadales bacterium]|nr:hypothetical protein [Pseudomonadales bacterium]NRA17042.1 hypothetical protein [Oceanospirillaceae bacterium]
MNTIADKAQLPVEKQVRLELELVREYRNSIDLMLQNGELYFQDDRVKAFNIQRRKTA